MYILRIHVPVQRTQPFTVYKEIHCTIDQEISNRYQIRTETKDTARTITYQEKVLIFEPF